MLLGHLADVERKLIWTEMHALVGSHKDEGRCMLSP